MNSSDNLEKYVENLFSKYRKTKAVLELKAEVLSNLEAKVSDLTSEGIGYEKAISIAKESIEDIDCLIDDNIKVYINRYRLEYAQTVLLYAIIVWIFTIPLLIFNIGIAIHIVTFMFAIFVGAYYFIKRSNKESDYYEQTEIVNLCTATRRRKTIWILWSMSIIITVLANTAIFFGSNIWFSRPITVDGPYQFATIAISYLLPFISIVIPLTFNVSPKLICKYEVE